ncbi:hypothetical protein [Wolbachia endosymbiont of Phyllotreta cruciferae]|uniref:hypothetical protein n=1 Tax=Wolbachia endosymbiont of Phyllotreta cruciferae TaxID=2886377 RepID=UPI0020A20BBC|nr:hypothetical protein [Wolbachia endosymbiont of Phyllotreta cruciferae]
MPETYPTGGAKNFIHGIDYQKLWLMLFFRRAVNRKYFFRLATEMSSAAGFDDIVFRYEQNGTTVCMLIQVKHKQDGSKKICVGDLLTKSGELNLVKHFAAFLEIQGNEEFKDKIKDFFIVINVDFDYESLASKGITVEKIETQDEFLNIGDSAKYKLRDLRNNIAQYLKQRMSAEDREVSDEEIKGFLNELVFVVNLPSDVELEKLIRNEINDDLARRFKYFGDNDSVLNALSTMISNWMKDKRGRFLTPEEGKEFFQKVELWASTLCGIERGVKKGNKGIDKIAKQQRKDSKTLNEIHAAVTAQNNKQRPHKKPYGPRDKKSKAREEGDIEELDEFDEIEALEFVKRALNIENNLQNKEIKKLAQELQYSQLALKLTITHK